MLTVQSEFKCIFSDCAHDTLQHYLFIFILYQLGMDVICRMLYLTAVKQRIDVRGVKSKKV